ncbi:hypothetical protein NDU88_004175 [Pleurodeles waltl]|uniref:Uncharacterized protein n=1 Tax=Pleurodeles waltl TaxID=8319 RepID=A0AAV7NSZ7_PLEWA|nr:hypothetical protein NDU88_004175 [Pleurodeles waltl]
MSSLLSKRYKTSAPSTTADHIPRVLLTPTAVQLVLSSPSLQLVATLLAPGQPLTALDRTRETNHHIPAPWDPSAKSGLVGPQVRRAPAVLCRLPPAPSSSAGRSVPPGPSLPLLRKSSRALRPTAPVDPRDAQHSEMASPGLAGQPWASQGCCQQSPGSLCGLGAQSPHRCHALTPPPPTRYLRSSVLATRSATEHSRRILRQAQAEPPASSGALSTGRAARPAMTAPCGPNAATARPQGPPRLAPEHPTWPQSPPDPESPGAAQWDGARDHRAAIIGLGDGALAKRVLLRRHLGHAPWAAFYPTEH